MALLFGTNNYVYVPPNAGFNTLTSNITVSCWVNIQTAGSMQMFINRQVSATPANEWWSLNLLGQSPRALIGDGASVLNVQQAGTPILVLNTWYFLAFTFNGTTCDLYRDGQLVGTGTRTQTFPADTSGVVIGANAQAANDTGVTEFTFGYIEDIRLYNRVLTQNELLCVMNCEGRDYIYDGLLFRLTMDELGEGTVANGANAIRDCGPMLMHGTPYGSCVYGNTIRGLLRPPTVL